MKTLKLNSTGQLVTQLQLLLNLLPDGIFGPQTQQSVIFFQKSQNITPDGIVGPITWSLLYDGWEMINNPNDEESLYTPYYLPNHAYHRSEEHTSELQSRPHLVCRLLLEKKKK